LGVAGQYQAYFPAFQVYEKFAITALENRTDGYFFNLLSAKKQNERGGTWPHGSGNAKVHRLEFQGELLTRRRKDCSDMTGCFWLCCFQVPLSALFIAV
jgi:hypothetical protein